MYFDWTRGTYSINSPGLLTLCITPSHRWSNHLHLNSTWFDCTVKCVHSDSGVSDGTSCIRCWKLCIGLCFETYQILSVFTFLLGVIWCTWIDRNWEWGHLKIDPACIRVEWHFRDAPLRRLDTCCGNAKTDIQYNSFPSHCLQIIIRQISWFATSSYF